MNTMGQFKKPDYAMLYNKDGNPISMGGLAVDAIVYKKIGGHIYKCKVTSLNPFACSGAEQENK